MQRTKHKTGQSIPEYALILSLIAIVSVLILWALGLQVRDVYCLIAGPFGLDDTCTILFQDAFENLDNWLNDRGNWWTEDDKVCGGAGESRLYHDLDADDYTIELDGAQLVKGNGYGVFFRSSEDPLNGYSFQYDPGYGAFIYRKWVDGRELSPFAVAKAPDFDWYNSGHNLSIDVRGDTFTTYIDGQPVLSGADSTYSSGDVGLRTWDSTTACFDDIVIKP